MIEHLEAENPEALEKAREIADKTYRSLETQALLFIPGLEDREVLERLLQEKIQQGKGEDNFAEKLSALAHEVVSQFIIESHLEGDEVVATHEVSKNMNFLVETMISKIRYFSPQDDSQIGSIEIDGKIF